MQRTLKGPVGFVGAGLHTGRPVRMTVHPASADYGIWFRRTDLDGDALIAGPLGCGGAVASCAR